MRGAAEKRGCAWRGSGRGGVSVAPIVLSSEGAGPVGAFTRGPENWAGTRGPSSETVETLSPAASEQLPEGCRGG